MAPIPILSRVSSDFGFGKNPNVSTSTSSNLSWSSIESDAAIIDGVYTLTYNGGAQFPGYIINHNSQKYLTVALCRVNSSSSNFHYDNAWWSSRSAFGQTIANAHIVNNTTNDFCSSAAFNVRFKYMLLTEVGEGTSISFYSRYHNSTEYSDVMGNGLPDAGFGSSNNFGIDREASNNHSPYESLVGNYHFNIPVGGGSSRSGYGNPGKICRRPRADAANSPSVSYVQWGIAYASENWNGGWWSALSAGLGVRSDSACIGGEGAKGSSGWTNARHNAGGCGDSPSETFTFRRFEISIRPNTGSDVWTISP